jgi:hypothetical protein
MEKVVPLLKPIKSIFYFSFSKQWKFIFGLVKNLKEFKFHLNLFEFDFLINLSPLGTVAWTHLSATLALPCSGDSVPAPHTDLRRSCLQALGRCRPLVTGPHPLSPCGAPHCLSPSSASPPPPAHCVAIKGATPRHRPPLFLFPLLFLLRLRREHPLAPPSASRSSPATEAHHCDGIPKARCC